MREAAQSKCKSTFNKNHFVQKMIGKNVARQKRSRRFVRTRAVEMQVNISINRDNVAPQNAKTLCEPAQSQCMPKFQKNHFLPKSTGRCRGPAGAPDQAPAFTFNLSYSMWKHCLGNKLILASCSRRWSSMADNSGRCSHWRRLHHWWRNQSSSRSRQRGTSCI